MAKFVNFPRQGADALYVNPDLVRSVHASGPNATAVYFYLIDKPEYVSVKVTDVVRQLSD